MTNQEIAVVYKWTAKPGKAEELKADVHILEYVDYSSKYGVGYMMSDGCFGVFFNDSTQVSNLAEQR